MKNKLVLFSTVLITTVCVWHYTGHKKSSDTKRPQVAIITLNSNYHERATEGFLRALTTDKAHQYDVKTYISEGHNKTLTTAIVNEAINKGANILVTVGASQSIITHAVNTKRLHQVPQVFIGAGDPVQSGIVKSISHPEGVATGVNTAEKDPFVLTKLLLFFKPNTTSVLIPYCPLSSDNTLERDAHIVASSFAQYGVNTRLLPIDKIGDVINKVKGAISDIDTIMYLEGDLIDEATEGLTKICNQHGITLFSANINAVRDGAVIGYGPDARYVGQKAYEYVRRITYGNEKPGNIPVCELSEGRRIAINVDACKKQGVTLSPEIKLCLSRGITFDGSGNQV